MKKRSYLFCKQSIFLAVGAVTLLFAIVAWGMAPKVEYKIGNHLYIVTKDEKTYMLGGCHFRQGTMHKLEKGDGYYKIIDVQEWTITKRRPIDDEIWIICQQLGYK